MTPTANYTPASVAQRIKLLAKERGISLQCLLEESGLGINTLSNMNHGRVMAFDSLARIADALECSVDFLLGRDTASKVKPTYSAQITKDRFKTLCKTKNTTAALVLSECELNVNAIRQINDTKGMASFSLAKIADYLDCSVDYLLGRTDKPEVNR